MAMELVTETRKGIQAFSLVEAILAIGLLSIFTTAIIYSVVYALEVASENRQAVQANHLLSSSLEAVRNIRDQNFANLAPGTYGITTGGNGEWVLSAGADTIDGFEREITITAPTSSTREVNVQVQWDGAYVQDRTVSAKALLRDIYRTLAQVGDWLNPAVQSTTDFSGGADGNFVLLDTSELFVARANGDIFVLDYSLNTIDNIDIGTGVNSLALDSTGDYLYAATNGDELIVLDVSDRTNISIEIDFNLPGGADGREVIVDGNNLYLIREGAGGQDEFYVYDITNPASPSQFTSIDLDSDPLAMVQVGNYLYVSGANDTIELETIDISTPSSPSVIDTYNIPGSGDISEIARSGDYLYLGDTGGELIIVDISSRTNPFEVTGVTYGNDLQGITVGPADYVFLGFSGGSSPYFVVVDVSDPNNPQSVANEGTLGPLDFLVYSSVDDLVYGGGESGGEELVIIEPGI